MNFGDQVVKTTNTIRITIQRHPKLPTVDHGESVAILLWWSFLKDHSAHEGIPVEELARTQLEAFIEFARKNLYVHRDGMHS